MSWTIICGPSSEKRPEPCSGAAQNAWLAKTIASDSEVLYCLESWSEGCHAVTPSPPAACAIECTGDECPRAWAMLAGFLVPQRSEAATSRVRRLARLRSPRRRRRPQTLFPNHGRRTRCASLLRRYRQAIRGTAGGRPPAQDQGQCAPPRASVQPGDEASLELRKKHMAGAHEGETPDAAGGVGTHTSAERKVPIPPLGSLWDRIETLSGEALGSSDRSPAATLDQITEADVLFVSPSGVRTRVKRQAIEDVYGALTRSGQLTGDEIRARVPEPATGWVANILSMIEGIEWSPSPLSLRLCSDCRSEETCGGRQVALPADDSAIEPGPSEGGSRALEPCEVEPIKIHVEIWVASRLLGEERHTFSASDLVARVLEEFGDKRPSVATYAYGSALRADAPARGVVYNYLYRKERGVLQCFDPDVHRPHQSRSERPWHPALGDVPRRYRLLLPGTVRGPSEPPPEPPTPPEQPMEWIGSESPQTLSGWNVWVQREMGHQTILAQLQLPRDALASLVASIRGLLSEKGLRLAKRLLPEQYPWAFAATLAFWGRYGYRSDRHAYWPGLLQALGVEDAIGLPAEWGQQFRNVIERLGLQADVRSERPLDLILFHGGLPESSLYGFFEHMLQPAVENAADDALSDEALIQSWLRRSAHYLVDEPVCRYLQHGGDSAQLLVGSCRALARGSLRSELPIPEYIESAYRRWRDGTGPGRPQTEEHWRAPWIGLDPWGGGVYVCLPEQVTHNADKPLLWTLHTAGRPAYRQPWAYAQNDTVRWSEERLDVPDPVAECTVTITQGDDLAGEWRLGVAPSSAPCLAFDPRTRRAVKLTQGQEGRVWLLLRPRVALTPESGSVVTEHLPQLSGGWHTWRGYEIDLTRTRTLEIQRGGRTECVLTRDVIDLSLEGGRTIAVEGGTPVYVVSPPHLRIGASRAKIDSCTLGLRVRSLGMSDPRVSAEIPLETLIRHSHTLEDKAGFLLALSDPELLGPDALGEYEITLLGATEERVRFRVASPLAVESTPTPWDPDPEGRLKYVFRVEGDTHLELSRPYPGTQLQAERADTAKRYTLSVPDNPALPAVPVAISRSVHDGATNARVNLTLMLPRLRWRIVANGAPDQTLLAWQNDTHQVLWEELEQAGSCALIVEAPMARAEATLRAELSSADGSTLQTETLERLRETARFGRLDLRRLAASVRESTSDTFRLFVTVPGPTSQRSLTREVLHITRGIPLAELMIVPVAGQTPTLEAHWAPGNRLRKRQLVLRSLARPWEPAVRMDIPDGSYESAELAVTTPLVEGPYEARFCINDRWRDEPEPELLGAGGACCLLYGNPETRFAMLAEQAEQRNECFACAAEQLLLAFHGYVCAPIEPLASNCVRFASFADPVHACALLVSLHLRCEAESLPRPSWLGALVASLCTPDRVRAAYRAYETGELSEHLWQCYIESWMLAPTADANALLALLDLVEGDRRLAVAGNLLDHGEDGAARTAVGVIVSMLQDGAISEDDAVSTLCVSPDLASDALLEMGESPATGRLLDGIARLHPTASRVIRVGHWVHTVAGWGRIDAIADAAGSPVVAALRTVLSDGYSLSVTVRPGQQDEDHLVYRPGQQLIEYGPVPLRGQRRRICAKCNSFITRVQDCLTQHNKSAHGLNIAKSYELMRGNMCRQKDDIRFSVDLPRSLWE